MTDGAVVDRKSISSEQLTDLYDHWSSLHSHEESGSTLPHVSQIDPLELPKGALPNLTLFDVSHEPFDLVVRLAGTNIVKHHETEQGGKRLMDVSDSPFIQKVFDWYRDAIDAREARVSNLSFVTKSGDLLEVERISLPYVDSSGKISRVLSGIDFKTVNNSRKF